ncbi:MAG: hypothetical protein ABI972_15175 [Acidobacteriota bacterium]
MSRPSVLLHHHDLIHPLMLARDLHRRGYRVEACADRPHSALRHSRHITAFHVVPSIDQPERLAHAICEIVRKRHIGMFLPGTDQVFALAPHHEMLADVAHYMFEDAPTLARVHDKLSLQAILRAAGILTPHAVPWDLGPLPAALHYPVVVKDVAGCGAIDCRVLRNDCDLVAARRQRRASRVPALLQQFVSGRTLIWMGVPTNGRLAASLTAERVLLVPAHAGPSVLRHSLILPELDRQCARILAAVPYRGFASLDLIQDGEGRFWFLDFNPRFCAALHTSLRCGISFADVLYQLAHGRAPALPPQRHNVYSLSLHRLAQRMVRSPSAFASSLAALRYAAAAEELFTRDPLPFLAAAAHRFRAKTKASEPGGAPVPAYSDGTHGTQRPQSRTHL